MHQRVDQDHIRMTGKGLTADIFPRLVSIQTRYADLDPQRHVNNAAIGTLLAEVRSQIAGEIFARCGREDRFVMMVGQFAVSYVRQVHHPEPCIIGIGVIEIGQRKVRVVQGLFQSGQCRAFAESVLIGTRDGLTAELPDPVAAAWRELALPEGLVPRQLR